MKPLFLLCLGALWCASPTAAQNVGIGVAMPQAKLHVQSNYETMRLQGQSAYVSFYDGAGNYAGYLWNRNNNGMDLGTPAGSDFSVLLSPNTTTVAGFYANETVGIGNANPAFRLDVSGRLRLRSGTEPAGVWFNGTGVTATTGFVGLYNDGHTGIFGSGYGWALLLNTATGNASLAGALPNSAKLTVQNAFGPALEIAGGIRVSGSTPAAFRLTATSANLVDFTGSRYNGILIDYALLNGDPAAMVMVTPVDFSPQVNVRLQYDGALNKWKLTSNDLFVPLSVTAVGNLRPCDGSEFCHFVNPMAEGVQWPGFQAGQTFNVLVVKQ